MKILYGVQGTGNGHTTRARHLSKAFGQYDDVQVDYLFSGRPTSQYFDMQDFVQLQTRKGLTFVSEKGGVNHLKTFAHNSLIDFIKDVKDLNIKKYDLLINDFEPISAWSARKANIPSISISHQAAFLHKVPIKQQGMLDKKLIKYFAPTKYNLGTHWYHFGNQILPPFVCANLIKEAHKASHTVNSRQILVYLPFEQLTSIKDQLTILSDWEFVCFHPHISFAARSQNISWHPPSTELFKKQLIKSAGVIANCGYELSTECISLGKPLLVKPLRKQFEQISNAYTLQQLGLCEYINCLDAELIDDWLQRKTAVQITYPTNCQPLADWIIKGNWLDTASICNELWQKVSIPDSVKSRLEKLKC
jgi:uncharacterized protein (TIGR00661 family)